MTAKSKSKSRWMTSVLNASKGAMPAQVMTALPWARGPRRAETIARRSAYAASSAQDHQAALHAG
ncbi:hypothetical protein BFP70_13440 [Thioclava sp. SK-1]|uniref:hypothetical protein n=1 Tax=Thioclava sp. SK-1 TaxID=1889770 RepID=UPI0008266973|nr:hypothetical protein [Thioclava sp. SK-1]OCX62804.1 hypothetical protein BFP70_13440 [Thioclava sp. SK-1]